MPYTHTNLAQARARVSERLHATDMVFWSPAEINSAIIEVLRMYQSLAAPQDTNVSFPTSTPTSVGFYDLTTLFPATVGYNVTDQQLVGEIQRHLIEPFSPTSWTGTDQFSMSQVASSMQRLRDRFRMDTGMVISNDVYSYSASSGPMFTFDDALIDVRRLAFINQSGTPYTLWRDDIYSVSSFKPSWATASSLYPSVYSLINENPLTIVLYPSPTANGSLHLLSVRSGPALNPSAGVTLNIPDDYSWCVKWGCLGELLATDGRSNDAIRAQFCEDMYGLALFSASTSPSQYQVYVNNVPIYSGSIFSADAGKPTWNLTPGQPRFAAFAGRNMFALVPQPDITYTVSMDIVTNMPVPSSDTDYLQCGREHLEAILGMAQHLLAFKEGSHEFSQTVALRKIFLGMLVNFNQRLSACSFFRSLMEFPSYRQERDFLRVDSTSETTQASQ